MSDASPEVFDERVWIDTHAGRLEGVLSYGMDRPRLACVVAPPHPFMGGTLQNNVLKALAAALAAAGHVCLRFNYRGVGESDGARVDVLAGMQIFWETGHAPDDPLLIADAREAISWLSARVDAPLVGVGYSFGAYALAAGGLTDFCGLAMILPTLARHDFEAVRCASLPRLVVYSDDDFATPASTVESWIARANGSVTAHCVPGGQHFFRGLESRVAAMCCEFVETLCGEVTHAA